MKTTIKKMTPAQYKAVFTCLVEQLRGKKNYFYEYNSGTKYVCTDKSVIENKYNINSPNAALKLGDGTFFNTCNKVKIWKVVDRSPYSLIKEIDMLSLYSYSNGPALIQEALQAAQDRVTLEMNAYECIVKLEPKEIVSKSEKLKYYSEYSPEMINNLKKDIRSSALYNVLSGEEPVETYSTNL